MRRPRRREVAVLAALVALPRCHGAEVGEVVVPRLQVPAGTLWAQRCPQAMPAQELAGGQEPLTVRVSLSLQFSSLESGGRWGVDGAAQPSPRAHIAFVPESELPHVGAHDSAALEGGVARRRFCCDAASFAAGLCRERGELIVGAAAWSSRIFSAVADPATGRAELEAAYPVLSDERLFMLVANCEEPPGLLVVTRLRQLWPAESLVSPDNVLDGEFHRLMAIASLLGSGVLLAAGGWRLYTQGRTASAQGQMLGLCAAAVLASAAQHRGLHASLAQLAATGGSLAGTRLHTAAAAAARRTISRVTVVAGAAGLGVNWPNLEPGCAAELARVAALYWVTTLTALAWPWPVAALAAALVAALDALFLLWVVANVEHGLTGPRHDVQRNLKAVVRAIAGWTVARTLAGLWGALAVELMLTRLWVVAWLSAATLGGLHLFARRKGPLGPAPRIFMGRNNSDRGVVSKARGNSSGGPYPQSRRFSSEEVGEFATLRKRAQSVDHEGLAPDGESRVAHGHRTPPSAGYVSKHAGNDDDDDDDKSQRYEDGPEGDAQLIGSHGGGGDAGGGGGSSSGVRSTRLVPALVRGWGVVRNALPQEQLSCVTPGWAALGAAALLGLALAHSQAVRDALGEETGSVARMVEFRAQLVSTEREQTTLQLLVAAGLDDHGASRPLRVAVLQTGMERALERLLDNQAWGLSAGAPVHGVAVDWFLCITCGEDAQNAESGQRKEMNFAAKRARWAAVLERRGLHLAHADERADVPIAILPRAISVNERSSPLKVAYQLQSASEAFDRMVAHEHETGKPYDVVVRLRTDSAFFRPVSYRSLLSNPERRLAGGLRGGAAGAAGGRGGGDGSEGSSANPDTLAVLLTPASRNRLNEPGEPSAMPRPRVFVPPFGNWGGTHDRFAIMDRSAALTFFKHRFEYLMRPSDQPLQEYSTPGFRVDPNAEGYLFAALRADDVRELQDDGLVVTPMPNGCATYHDECPWFPDDMYDWCVELSCDTSGDSASSLGAASMSSTRLFDASVQARLEAGEPAKMHGSKLWRFFRRLQVPLGHHIDGLTTGRYDRRPDLAEGE
jgi:hypothetical protein